MRNDLHELVFILDKSGSMEGLEGDTIGGFNANLKAQKELGGDAHVTTVLFDDGYEVLHDRIDINAVLPMTDKEYQIGGMTALLDAVGKTIHKIRNIQKKTDEDFRSGKVIFVIITDGQENSSREYSYDDIKKLIEHQQDKYGWEFIFLGANIDAFAEAGRLGIPLHHTSGWTANSAGVDTVWGAIANSTIGLRVGLDIKMDDPNIRR